MYIAIAPLNRPPVLDTLTVTIKEAVGWRALVRQRGVPTLSASDPDVLREDDSTTVYHEDGLTYEIVSPTDGPFWIDSVQGCVSVP